MPTINVAEKIFITNITINYGYVPLENIRKSTLKVADKMNLNKFMINFLRKLTVQPAQPAKLITKFAKTIYCQIYKIFSQFRLINNKEL